MYSYYSLSVVGECSLLDIENDNDNNVQALEMYLLDVLYISPTNTRNSA